MGLLMDAFREGRERHTEKETPDVVDALKEVWGNPHFDALREQGLLDTICGECKISYREGRSSRSNGGWVTKTVTYPKVKGVSDEESLALIKKGIAALEAAIPFAMTRCDPCRDIVVTDPFTEEKFGALCVQTELGGRIVSPEMANAFKTLISGISGDFTGVVTLVNYRCTLVVRDGIPKQLISLNTYGGELEGAWAQGLAYEIWEDGKTVSPSDPEKARKRVLSFLRSKEKTPAQSMVVPESPFAVLKGKFK